MTPISAVHISSVTRRLPIFLLLPFVVLGLTGCSGLLGDFTMATTKNVSMTDTHQRIGKTEGKDGKVFSPPSLKLAVDQALDNAGPEATYLTNVRIHHTSFMFWSRMRVEGEAWAPEGTLSEADGPAYHLERTDAGQFLVSEDGSDRIEVFHVR